MTHLKTLKDLMKPANCKNYDMLIKAGDLKAEAIKWIKEDLEEQGMTYNRFKEPWKSNTKPVVEWIKHFFNITEEDLSEDKNVQK